MKKLSHIYKGEKLNVVVNLFKILKRKHLFGSFILDYESPAERAKQVNNEARYIHDYKINTDKISFNTNSSKFMREIKMVNLLLKQKPRTRTSLTDGMIIDSYLEDYFKNNHDKLATKKTYFDYGIYVGLILLMCGFTLFVFLLSGLISTKILIAFLIILALYVGYVQCRLCV